MCHRVVTRLAYIACCGYPTPPSSTRNSSMNSIAARALAILTVTAAYRSTPALAQQEATGAGASFPAPLYAKWAADYYKETGVKINYQSVGSSAGLKQIEAKTVDFGASDEPLKDADQVLGDIYLGKVTRWNDPAIAALNPGLNLPDAKISPVRRADGSGTTFGFTNYLSKVNAEWKSKVGEGKAVNWPTGAGGKGNEGVAAFVGRLANSIGYVEYAYVKQNKLTYAQLQNQDGKYVSPSEDSFKAAAAGANWSQSFYQILTNQPGQAAWPITSATFILMHKAQDKPAQAQASLKFFEWAYKSGDQTASGLDYVPMPDNVKDVIFKSWGSIQDTAGKAIALQ